VDFLEGLRTRRACREFTGQPVSRDQIGHLIELARLAPSAMNRQPWAFAALQGTQRLHELSIQAHKAALEFLLTDSPCAAMPSIHTSTCFTVPPLSWSSVRPTGKASPPRTAVLRDTPSCWLLTRWAWGLAGSVSPALGFLMTPSSAAWGFRLCFTRWRRSSLGIRPAAISFQSGAPQRSSGYRQ
jgi:nitroreductase